MPAVNVTRISIFTMYTVNAAQGHGILHYTTPSPSGPTSSVPVPYRAVSVRKSYNAFMKQHAPLPAFFFFFFGTGK